MRTDLKIGNLDINKVLIEKTEQIYSGKEIDNKKKYIVDKSKQQNNSNNQFEKILQIEIAKIK